MHCRFNSREVGLSGLSSSLNIKKLYMWLRLLFVRVRFFFDLWYAKKDEEYSTHEKDLLTNPRLTNVEFQQNGL